MVTLLFHLSAISVLPFWGAMIFAPRSALTARMVRTPWICLTPAFCYLALLVPHLDLLVPALMWPSPEALAAVMGEPWAASLFWAYAGALTCSWAGGFTSTPSTVA